MKQHTVKQDLVIMVFYQDGNVPFIFDIRGRVTVKELQNIEEQLIEESESFDPELFDKGDGEYEFKLYYHLSYDGHPPYWEFIFVSFVPESDWGYEEESFLAGE